MREERFKQTIRVQLLSLVLALALTWYAMNPAPGPVRRARRDEEIPDEERRMTKPPAAFIHKLELMEADAVKSAVASHCSETEVNIEDLEWPEVIDVR
ncbi:MAG TPA: hypothetical protein VM934_03430 [Pyrinomonadaceae bacterium]|nr:hypothetical protein [Pyrinomonadaceae bacterium]